MIGQGVTGSTPLFCTFLVILCLRVSDSSTLTHRRCLQKKHHDCKFEPDKLELWCDDSNVTEIPDPESMPITFARVEHAEAIFMNHSCIQRINTATLRTYRLLKVLDLNDNSIVSLPEASFTSCSKLETLRMARNKLTFVRDDTFAGLEGLLELDLGRNHIASIELGTFDDLIKLQVLKLNNNKLKHLEEKSFQNLIFLRSLDLSGNALKTLTVWHLSGLAQLTFLDLRNNHLTSIDGNMFVSTSRLEHLDLRNNLITCLEHNIFSRTDVSAVKLNNNKLRIPQPDWFRKLRRKERRKQFLDVDSLTSNNPWHCGCKSIAYLRFLKYEIGDLGWWVRKLDIQCASPPAFQGRMLSTLTEKVIYDHFNGSCSLLTSEKHFCVEKILSEVEKFNTTTTVETFSPPSGCPPNFLMEGKKCKPISAETSGLERSWNLWKMIVIFVGGALFVVVVLLVFFVVRRCHTNKALPQSTTVFRQVCPNCLEFSHQSSAPIKRPQGHFLPKQGHHCERPPQNHCQQNGNTFHDNYSYCSSQGNGETFPIPAFGNRCDCSSPVFQHQGCHLPAYPRNALVTPIVLEKRLSSVRQ